MQDNAARKSENVRVISKPFECRVKHVDAIGGILQAIAI
jgi:hypothetical protein